ncbi:hypothetical protein [Bacillus phage DZ1]|uniref:Uncharacterized protein n=1 Tax=Bacillus phage DZ1 TaxID=3075862 RepID=A0AA96EKU6_9CAUD|nr:hypothetical protein [Bacillus phage DZ1]
MGVTTEFIEQLKLNVRNLKDAQAMCRHRITEQEEILAQVKAECDAKIDRENQDIAYKQREIDNLEFTIKLLESQLPPEPPAGESPPPANAQH